MRGREGGRDCSHSYIFTSMKHTERERGAMAPGDEKLEPSQQPEEDTDPDENGGVLKTDG